jgi:hypothetical protein
MSQVWPGYSMLPRSLWRVTAFGAGAENAHLPEALEATSSIARIGRPGSP